MKNNVVPMDLQANPMLIMNEEFAQYQGKANDRAKHHPHDESSETDGEPRMLVTQMSATKTQLGHYNASNIDMSESHQNIEDEKSRQRRYKEMNMASMGQLTLLE